MKLYHWVRIVRLATIIIIALVCSCFLLILNNIIDINQELRYINAEILDFDRIQLDLNYPHYVNGNATVATHTLASLDTDEMTSGNSENSTGSPHVHQIKMSAYSPSNLATIFTTFAYPNSSKFDPSSTDYEQALYSQAHYKNTMIMLGNLRPKICPVIFTNDPIAIELALSANNTVHPITKSNVFGMPLLNRMFIEAMETQPSFFYGYTNGDMLYPKYDLIKNLDILQGLIERGELKENVLLIGRRTDVYITTSMVYLDKDINDLAAKGQFNTPDAQDFIFVTRDSLDWHIIPDFVVGRTAYDNWLVDFAYHRDLQIIDLTQTLVAIHQTGLTGVRASHWAARGIDRKWNFPLARGRLDHGTLDFAQFVSGFRFAQRGNVQVRYWTLKHKERNEFYFECEYDSLVKS